MLLWLAILVLTSATVFVVTRPLFSPVENPDALGAADAGTQAVYRDQLRELQSDLGRGVIGAAEAEAARVEISRRLLAQAGRGAAPAAATTISPVVRAALLGAIPIAALGLYLFLGTPGLPARPFVEARRIDARPQDDVASLVAQVEARLRSHPEDGRGWEVLGPVYLRLQRYDDARIAFDRAIALLGETPKRLMGFAESAVRASDGIVTDEASDAFAKVLKAEPGRIEARFWIALAREQRGESQAALVEYRAILDAGPADAPWRPAVMERIAAVEAAAGKPAPKGPSEADVAAAASMTPEARRQMIGGMVEGLHQRLKSEQGDVEGWQKLVRAYMVMGEAEKARAALAEARQALAGNANGLGAVEALAREVGVVR